MSDILVNNQGSEMGMNVTEKVINDLSVAKLALCHPQMLTPEMCVRIGQTITSAIALLKEQEAVPYEEFEKLRKEVDVKNEKEEDK